MRGHPSRLQATDYAYPGTLASSVGAKASLIYVRFRQRGPLRRPSHIYLSAIPSILLPLGLPIYQVPNFLPAYPSVGLALAPLSAIHLFIHLSARLSVGRGLTLAPLSARYLIVGSEARMRVSSVMVDPSSGTFRSQRTSTLKTV